MKKIDTLSSLEGRIILKELFKNLKYEKQISSFSTLVLTWRICTYEKEIFKYSSQDILVLHTLGLFAGTALWMEEIINRHFYSTINSFVYFGAAILLTLIGIRRFSDFVSDTLVITGVAFEAMMLIFMFIVMLFTPNEEFSVGNYVDETQISDNDEIMLEIGEISREFASAVVQIEKMNLNITNLIEEQKEILVSLHNISESNSIATSPNLEFIEYMKQTNFNLKSFNECIIKLNESVDKLKREEIEIVVKKQLDEIFTHKIVNLNNQV